MDAGLFLHSDIDMPLLSISELSIRYIAATTALVTRGLLLLTLIVFSQAFAFLFLARG